MTGLIAPGESRVIAGAIRLKTPQSQKYWAGLVREQIGWLQDNAGAQRVTVKKRKSRLKKAQKAGEGVEGRRRQEKT